MSVKIDRISETKRGRFALFSNGEFLFSVDDETLVKFHISEGSSLTDEELYYLQKECETRKAKDQALRYLSLRAYGEKELYNKVCQKYDSHSAAAAMAALQEIGLLDDAAFATEKAKGMASRGKSSTEIKRKLYEIGIDRELAAQVASEYEEDDIQNAVRLIEKMYLEKLRRGEDQKVKAALARRGFNYAIVRDAIDKVKQEQEINASEEFDWM